MEDDFISTLNADEKLLFLRSLLAMIKADGRIDDKERTLAHELARLYDVAGCSEVLKNPQPKSMLLNEMKALAGNRKKAMLLLRELLMKRRCLLLKRLPGRWKLTNGLFWS